MVSAGYDFCLKLAEWEPLEKSEKDLLEEASYEMALKYQYYFAYETELKFIFALSMPFAARAIYAAKERERKIREKQEREILNHPKPVAHS